MGRDDEDEAALAGSAWDDVRDEERGTEGGYTSGPDVEALRAARQRPKRPSRAPLAYQRSDDRIREDVYDRLCGDTGADASEVTVEVFAGAVTLAGTVPDPEDMRRIVLVAERVTGVKQVLNQLRVGAPV
jgi:osmotically-inducible protein OsmY